MPSSARRSSGHLSVAAFRAWRASRPDEERWELIDGVPVMMTPPTLAHQRITSNLERLLNDALEAANLPFEAYQRAGLNLANVEYYDPEPDVIVVNLAAAPRPALLRPVSCRGVSGLAERSAHHQGQVPALS